MAILSLDQYIASVKQLVTWVKTTTRTTIAATWFSLYDVAGNPGAGTLNVGNTANGLVPTQATNGFPRLNAFSGSNGYVANIDFGSSVACRFMLFDRLFHAGAYSFNSNVVLTAQPSYAARIPGGDYKGTQIWIEAVTAFTGNLSVNITYTNQDGITGRTAGTIALGTAPTVGRMIQIPLQAGDTGVRAIESVVASVSTVGTFNVLVLRPLWTGRVRLTNDGDTHGLDKTGMPEIFQDSALFIAVNADGTSSGIPEFLIEVANG